VVALGDLGAEDVARAGGKGANLGELIRAGLAVPPGFCVTTDAYRTFVASASDASPLLDALAALAHDDTDGARAMGERLRTVLEAAPIPHELARDIEGAWRQAGADRAYAVRSSATAEDLPGASFAGQQDTYLNVRGERALLDAVRRCWASLFTERAILYRARNGFDHREVALAVVVQQMVDADVAGILFTADPVSGDRLTTVIDAGFGLGEALVSGVVTADRFRIDRRRGAIIERHIADKGLSIVAAADGGVERVALPDERSRAASLTDRQVLELTALGTRIAEHFGRPQDIEWAYRDGELTTLQARPITSLYPLPVPRPADGGRHLYFSFAHAQGVLEPMTPLGLSTWRVLLPFGRPDGEENPYLALAGGRMYLDLSPVLRHPLGRRVLPGVLANADPLAPAALRGLVADPAFLRHGERAGWGGLRRTMAPVALRGLAWLTVRRLDGAAPAADRAVDGYLVRARRDLDAAAGPQRLHAAYRVLEEVFLQGAWKLPPFIVGGILGYHLLRRWAPAGHDEDVAAVSRGLSGNVTTEMDLRVGDLADVARPYPELTTWLADARWTAQERLQRARRISGSDAFLEALEGFLERYGMRGPAEIDVARPRWRDDPTSLLGMIASNLQHDTAGAHRARHAALAEAGTAAAERLARAARRGPWGWLRGPVVARLTRVARTLPVLREHPKYLLVRALDLVRPLVLDAGAELVAAGRLELREDVWWLTWPELLAAAGGHEPETQAVAEQGTAEDETREPTADELSGAGAAANPDLRAIVAARRADQDRFSRLTPPRLMTSEGFIPSLAYRTGTVPAGALVGSAVSPGVVEGRARVVLDPARAGLEPGEILVAPFTDPGWTPLFTQAAGLVMEVGGLMTHGSVVAREYGLPAVVGVENATTLIATGQRIRLHGDAGYVELLDEGTPDPADDVGGTNVRGE
jgi:pyruvate,water dikinase